MICRHEPLIRGQKRDTLPGKVLFPERCQKQPRGRSTGQSDARTVLLLQSQAQACRNPIRQRLRGTCEVGVKMEHRMPAHGAGSLP